MVSSSGQEIFNSSAFLRTFDTVFRDTLQLNAMFRSLKSRLRSLIISRYLVMVLTLLIVYLHQSVHEYSIRNLYNGFHKSGILIALCRNSGFRIAGMMVSTAGIVALCCRNGGSQTPDRWLNESRNTQQARPKATVSTVQCLRFAFFYALHPCARTYHILFYCPNYDTDKP